MFLIISAGRADAPLGFSGRNQKSRERTNLSTPFAIPSVEEVGVATSQQVWQADGGEVKRKLKVLHNPRVIVPTVLSAGFLAFIVTFGDAGKVSQEIATAAPKT